MLLNTFATNSLARRVFSAIALVLGLAAVAPTAWAQGYEIIYERTDGSGERAVILVSPFGVVVNPGQDAGVYADFQAGRILALDQRNRRAVDMGRPMAGMPGMSGASAPAAPQGSTDAIDAVQQQMEAMLEGMLANVPEGQRAAAEAAMRAQMGLPPAGSGGGGARMPAGGGAAMTGAPELLYLDEPVAELPEFSDFPVDGFFEFETPDGMIAGFTPRGARVDDSGRPMRVLIIAPAVEISSAEWSAHIKSRMRELADLWREISGRPLPPEAIVGDFLQIGEDEFIFGYRSQDEADQAWWRLVAVRQARLGPDMAQPPEGYAVR